MEMMRIAFFVSIALILFGLYYERVFGFVYKVKLVSPDAKVILKEYWGGKKYAGAFVGMRFVPKLTAGCLVTFELINGKVVTLLVSEKFYDSISVGSRGTLEYSRKNFESFTLNEST